MNVVALLSGGKDSCYTLLRTRLHENKMVAVAHITPPCDEPDSFMYQSVGSAAVPLIAKALNLPLYTQSTHARAKETGLSYTQTDDDEVEDLVELLRKVKGAHPDLQAVCAGALWSDYQRLRVEYAASKVGILSLAYLWRREQSDLLDEMIASGMHAILIKVAGVGLTRKHLGQTLEQMRPTLHHLEEKYGSHVCGEGGEYETLVLWMPGFEKRIAIHDPEIVLHSHNSVAPVSYMRIERCTLEPLSEDQKTMRAPPSPITPDAFVFEPHKKPLMADATHLEGTIEHQEGESVGFSDQFLHVATHSDKRGRKGVADAASRLKAVLLHSGEKLGNVLYVTLHLDSVSGPEYADANIGYNEIFGVKECTPPPSRACIGVFSGNPSVTLEALVRRNRFRDRKGSYTMHVQSLSEWAPPCIGPYSQFIEEDGILHVCGVIPLHAPTASILPGMPVRKQVEACVYNMRKTLEASHSCFENLRLFLIYVTLQECVDTIEEQIQRLINHDQHITVLLPVFQLPKGGVVEIRAVGVTPGATLLGSASESVSEATFSEGPCRCDAVSCNGLSFMVVTDSEADSSKHEVSKMITDCLTRAPFHGAKILSIQLHTVRSEDNLTTKLKESFKESAVSVFAVGWMPRGSSFSCVATFVSSGSDEKR